MHSSQTASRRQVLAAAAFCALLPAQAQQAADSPWVDQKRSVRFIVPFGAGGYTDTISRLVAQRLGSAFGQPTAVENRPGANGVIRSAELARAANDEYTLLLVAPGHAGNVTMVPKLPYDTVKDFAPINLLVTLPSVIIVPASSQYSTFQELLTAARSKPGRLNYGSGGNGSSQHMAMETLKAKAGISLTHIPYRGSSFAEGDLLAGQIDVMFSSAISAIPFAKAGKVRILAISGATRSAVLPDVPTIAESGVAGFNAVTWLGFLAPAGTPEGVLNKLNAEVEKSMPSINHALAHGAGTDLRVAVYASPSAMFQGNSAS